MAFALSYLLLRVAGCHGPTGQEQPYQPLSRANGPWSPALIAEALAEVKAKTA